MIEPHRVAAQFYNRPLLLTPSVAQTISSFLLSRFEMGRRGAGGGDDAGTSAQAFNNTPKPDGSLEMHSPRASRFVGEYRSGPDGRPTPYRVTRDGTAVISVIGELVNRGAWVGASSGLVSYEGTKHALSTAARDDQVSAILLDLETPGGEAVGAFEVAAMVRQIRESKPVIAFVNGMAASAGYAMASGASRIVSIPSGLSGSIGVVMVHMDVSAYLEGEGVKPTLIFAGAHKVDGNPFEPLPDAVRADFQKEINSFMDMFVATVSAGRAGMNEQAVRRTEARVFMGEDARRVGLVDDVATFDDFIAALAAPQTRSSLLGRRTMVATGNAPTMLKNALAPSALALAALGISLAPPDVPGSEPAPAADSGATPPEAAPEEPSAASSAEADLAALVVDTAAAAKAAAPAGSPFMPAPGATAGQPLTFDNVLPDAAGAPAAPGTAPAVTPAPAAIEPPAEAAGSISRMEAAAILDIAQLAARLGIKVDAGAAIAKGIKPDALRQQVLKTAADRSDATAVIATTTTPPKTAGGPKVEPAVGESALVKKARETAAAQLKQRS
jgi:signal peptide peptidase SppA